MEEAFLDVSGATRRLGSPATIAERIRAVIADEQQITCSVGVATGKMVAKIASRQAKPDGVVVVPADETLSFLHPLPVEEIWGVGEKTAEQLHRLGIVTISDIAHTSRLILQRVLGLSAGSALYDLAWGRDHRPVTPMVPDRSIGAEHTFGFDVDTPEVIERELLALTGRTARRMRSSGLAGRTVTVKIRFADFTTITRSRTLPKHTDVARDLYAAARATYRSLGLERARIRLVGVRVEGLLDAQTPRQLDLLEPEFGWRSAEAAADAAADRYGSGAVQPAALLNRNTG
jgi:DNA polymerase-4